MNSVRNAIVAAGLLAATGTCLAAGAISLEREVTVDTTPDTVWKLVGNFNALDVWHPAVVSSTMKGAGTKAGATRVLTLGNGALIKEKLTAYSSTKHSYTYAITESPLPVKNYSSTISLSPAGEGKTLVKWQATFDANGASDDEATKVMQGVYDGGLTRVGAIFKK
ncbi:MAG: SRPBCC family protein [Gammaproteobacteria bacterium]|jgi:mxaD protein|nr:SRPBCC family protein [Gammaproteobacteria bacterium]MBU0771625.1 SRPBCC family protein [Gammaproteobacteria bacterium]MBU0856898.1 SRPBCC family protein [Gammaproteobacteria bacterium]MBU1848199.1 SRPBCC family protein [Gammaproteobacteria bacterium]